MKLEFETFFHIGDVVEIDNEEENRLYVVSEIKVDCFRKSGFIDPREDVCYVLNNTDKKYDACMLNLVVAVEDRPKYNLKYRPISDCDEKLEKVQNEVP